MLIFVVNLFGPDTLKLKKYHYTHLKHVQYTKQKKILKKKERERRAEIGSHTDDEMRCMHIFHLFFYILFLCFYVYV